ncbi:hypothetical protein [Weissella viridescens]|uniref:hypothetical protein n=1 Tax=Weissella viridescens TaxID=1629 RepID=UPI003AF26526
MKIPKLKGLNRDKQASDSPAVPPLEDRFQFDLSDLKLDVDTEQMLQSVAKEVQQHEDRTYEDTKPYASFIFVEELIRKLKQLQKDVKVEGLGLVEYDFPTLREHTKKNVHPEKQIVDHYDMAFKVNANIVHLPQVIAEYFMNLEQAEVDYEARKSYIKEILDVYDRLYGVLFEKYFGCRPNKAVDLPSESKWSKLYQKQAYIVVPGLYNAGNIDPNVSGQKDSAPLENTEVVNMTNVSVSPTPTPTAVTEIPETQPDHTQSQPHEENFSGESQHNQTTELPVVQTDANNVEQSVAQPRTLPEADQRLSRRTQKGHNFELEELFDQLDAFRGSAHVQLEVPTPSYVDDLPEEDERFVENQVNKFTSERNKSLQSSITAMNKSSETQLGKQIDNFKDQIEALATKLDDETNVEEIAKEIVTPIIKSDKESAYKKALDNLDKAERDAIASENEKHEAELKRIKQDAKADRDKLVQTNDQEYEKKYDEKYQSVLADETKKFENERSQKIQTALSVATSHLQTAADELIKTMNGFVSSQQQDLVEALPEYEKEQREMHLKAVQLQQQDMSMVDQGSMLQDLSERNASKDQIIQQDAEEIERLQEEVLKLKSQNKGLQQAEIKLNSMDNGQGPQSFEDTLQLIKTIKEVTQEQPQSPETKKDDSKGHGLRMGIFAGIGTLLLGATLGGGGYLYAQQKAEDAAKMTSMQTDLASAKAKQKKTEAKAASLSESKKKAAKASNGQASHADKQEAESDVADLRDLDDALDQNDLSVYYSKYKGQDLKTDNRVLAVGKALVQANDSAEAIQVVKDNPDHNTLLKQYLGM